MNQTYLIDNITFQNYEDLSVNIKPDRIKVFVKKAQELDLKPFLGYALYYDFIKHFNADGTLQDDTPQCYKDLLNGTEYLDKRGHVVLYEGLVPALVYFTFARFVEADAIHYTATGPVIKHHDYADTLSPDQVTKLVEQHRSVANAHANEVEKFLWDNRQQFPLWYCNEKNRSSRQAGPRIRAVDKTNFNYPADNATVNNYPPLNQLIN